MKLKTFTFLGLLGTVAVANAAVPESWEVSPADGAVVSELKEIVITGKNSSDVYSYATPNITLNGEKIAVTGQTSGFNDEVLTYTLNAPVTAPGEYEIVVGAGSFYYGWYEDDNTEMSWKITIEEGASSYTPNIPSDFEVTPGNGAVISKLEEITVLYSAGVHIYSMPTANITLNGKKIAVTGQTSGDYYDLLTWTLKEPVTEPGEYEIVLSAGAFYYGISEEDSPEMSWKFTIEGGGTTPEDPEVFEPYENKDVTINPEQGKYTSLKSFTLTFYNVTLPDINYLKKASLINDATNEVVATGKASEGSIIQQLIVDLDREVTEPGTYTLLCPEGLFWDGGSWDEEDLPEMKFRYIIASDGSEIKPADYIVIADPEDGATVSALESVMLTYPEFDNIYQHDNSGICVKDSEGEIVATGSISYGNNTEANQITVSFKPAITEKGEYTVVIPERAFSLGDFKETVYSAEVVLNYKVSGSTGIGNIEVEANKAQPVYNILGVKVADSLENLPAGLYISNGRKVVIR